MNADRERAFRSIAAKRIEVIETRHLYGKGTVEEPYRNLRSWFTLDGTMLAQIDEMLTEDMDAQWLSERRR